MIILTQSQSISALICMALVAAAVFGSMALTAVFGVKFNPMTTNVLPFLLLGLGVDDLFVIMCNFPRPHNRTAAEQNGRVNMTGESDGDVETVKKNKANNACVAATAAMLAEIGPSITLTSFTNAGEYYTFFFSFNLSCYFTLRYD